MDRLEEIFAAVALVTEHVADRVERNEIPDWAAYGDPRPIDGEIVDLTGTFAESL